MDEYVLHLFFAFSSNIYLEVLFLFYFLKEKNENAIFFFTKTGDQYRESEMELLQRYRRDRRILLDFILSGSLIKKVVMPPGAVTLDDVDLDQVSVDYVLNCVKKGNLYVYL